MILVLAAVPAFAAETDTIRFPRGCSSVPAMNLGPICTDAYAIDRTEVTVEAYQRCIRAGACANVCAQGDCSCLCNSSVPGRAQHPMNCVYYSEAENYCRWNGQRLPTDAEWTRATLTMNKERLLSPLRESDPGCEHPGQDGCRSSAGGKPTDNCAPRTQPVCSIQLENTKDGICDLAGNVREFVDDWFEDDWPKRAKLSRKLGLPVMPACANQRGEECFLSARGSSYATAATTVAAGAAEASLPVSWIQPRFLSSEIGFRCVTDEKTRTPSKKSVSVPTTALASESSMATSTPPPPPHEPIAVPATCVTSPASAGWRLCLDAFAIDKSEVTVEAYQRCVDAGVCRRACNDAMTCSAECNAGRPGRGTDPINCVGLADAETYCRWNGQRLPFDVEWELAALGPTGHRRKYPWGDDAETCDRVARKGCRSSSNAASATDAPAATAPVCSTPDGNTVEGMCDAAGNVAEWTLNWICDWTANRKRWARRVHGHRWTLRESPSVLEGTCEKHAGPGRLRGGSYLEYESYLGFPKADFGPSLDWQGVKRPTLAVPAVGFRCVTETRSAKRNP